MTSFTRNKKYIFKTLYLIRMTLTFLHWSRTLEPQAIGSLWNEMRFLTWPKDFWKKLGWGEGYFKNLGNLMENGKSISHRIIHKSYTIQMLENLKLKQWAYNYYLCVFFLLGFSVPFTPRIHPGYPSSQILSLLVITHLILFTPFE